MDSGMDWGEGQQQIVWMGNAQMEMEGVAGGRYVVALEIWIFSRLLVDEIELFVFAVGSEQ